MTTIFALSYRYQLADFPAFWSYGPFGTLVPYPKQNANLSASFQPLSYQVITPKDELQYPLYCNKNPLSLNYFAVFFKQVWIAIFVSVCIFPLCLRLISICNPSQTERQRRKRPRKTPNYNGWALYFYFVLGDLVSQGYFDYFLIVKMYNLLMRFYFCVNKRQTFSCYL